MPDCKKSISTAALAACCLLIGMVLQSCSTVGLSEDKKDNEVLKASVEAFNFAFRWEDYIAAAVWIPAGKKESFWKEVDSFKGKIRVIDAKIRDLDHVEDSGAATAIVIVQYYRMNAPNLQTATISQKWFFSEKDKAWQLGNTGFEAITKKAAGTK